MAKPAGPPKKELYGAEGASGIDEQVRSHVKGVMEGSIKRYDDATVAKMKQGLHETTRGQAKQAKRSLRSEMARSGMLRSGALLKGGMDIDRAASANYSRGVRDIMLEKAKAEFDDKNVAIQQAQQWLSQKQQYDLGLKQMETTLEAAGIQAGATLGAAKLSADATRAAAGASAGAAKFAAQKQYELGKQRLGFQNKQLMFQAAALGLSIT